MKVSMGPEIDPHGSYATGLLWEFYYYYRVNPRRGQKKNLKRFYLDGALLLGQNRVLVLLINFFHPLFFTKMMTKFHESIHGDNWMMTDLGKLWPQFNGHGLGFSWQVGSCWSSICLSTFAVQCSQGTFFWGQISKWRSSESRKCDPWQPLGHSRRRNEQVSWRLSLEPCSPTCSQRLCILQSIWKWLSWGVCWYSTSVRWLAPDILQMPFPVHLRTELKSADVYVLGIHCVRTVRTRVCSSATC